jgi:carbon storage regulator CsrA
MLILSRKCQESLVIADQIVVTILDIDIDGAEVQLGIDAPAEIVVACPEMAPYPETEPAASPVPAGAAPGRHHA